MHFAVVRLVLVVLVSCLVLVFLHVVFRIVRSVYGLVSLVVAVGPIGVRDPWFRYGFFDLVQRFTRFYRVFRQ